MEMDWIYGQYRFWNFALSMTLVRFLAGLRSLRLHINDSIGPALCQAAKVREDALGLYQNGRLDFVYKMAVLPLIEVLVLVRPLSAVGCEFTMNGRI